MTRTPALQVEIAESIATVVVSRPDRLNALDSGTLDEMGETVHTLRDAEDVRGVIITGAGSRAFVAGADISELGGMDGLAAVDLSRRGQAVFRDIETANKPFVAAIQGFALGGGLELALACHLRVADRSATLGFPEVKLGIIPGYGGTVRLPRLVGQGRALEMILTGEAVSAEEAYRIGLVNRVVDDGGSMAAALDLLQAITANGPLAVARAIESVVGSGDASTEAALRHEANLFGFLAGTEDMHEGMAAFLARRRPRFRGR